MTRIPRTSTGRRRYLKGVGLGLAGIAGLSVPASAEEEDEDTLAEPPGFFAIYAAEGGSADTTDDFGFSQRPFFPGANPGDEDDNEGGLFDGDGIRITPNQKTLHHELRLFGGLVMDRKPKPYVLVHEGDGYYESRGQTVNFTARPANDIAEDLQELLPDSSENESSQENPLLTTIAGKKWRAVAKDQMKVNLDVDSPYPSMWANTRVDLYSRGGGRPTRELSLLYMLWAEDAADWDTTLGPYPFPSPEDTVIDKATELIEEGPLNMGGK